MKGTFFCYRIISRIFLCRLARYSICLTASGISNIWINNASHSSRKQQNKKYNKKHFLRKRWNSKSIGPFKKYVTLFVFSLTLPYVIYEILYFKTNCLRRMFSNIFLFATPIFVAINLTTFQKNLRRPSRFKNATQKSLIMRLFGQTEKTANLKVWLPFSEIWWPSKGSRPLVWESLA
jgi:hypothetical protein